MEDDELFADELARGHAWQVLVAMRLLQAGLVVQVSRLMLWRTTAGLVGRPPIEQFTSSDVDIMVGRKTLVPIEVKSRRFAFSTPSDYPYADAMVGTVDSWKQATIRPQVVVLVSQQTRAMLAVNVVATFPDWAAKGNHDQVRGITNDSYFCPRTHLRSFAKLVGWLRQGQ